MAHIDFRGYVESLTQELFRILEVEGSIHLVMDVQDIVLNVERAVPCGLIINELLTNIRKHAFPQGRKGTVRIRFRRDKDDSCRLSVQDDGVGFPEGIDLNTEDTLGLHLIKILSEQLGGSVVLNRRNGTAVTLTFPCEV